MNEKVTIKNHYISVSRINQFAFTLGEQKHIDELLVYVLFRSKKEIREMSPRSVFFENKIYPQGIEQALAENDDAFIPEVINILRNVCAYQRIPEDIVQPLKQLHTNCISRHPQLIRKFRELLHLNADKSELSMGEASEDFICQNNFAENFSVYVVKITNPKKSFILPQLCPSVTVLSPDLMVVYDEHNRWSNNLVLEFSDAAIIRNLNETLYSYVDLNHPDLQNNIIISNSKELLMSLAHIK